MKFQGNTALVSGGANRIDAAICGYATEGVGDGELVFTSMPTVTLLRDAIGRAKQRQQRIAAIKAEVAWPRKRELINSWPAGGDGAGDMAHDQIRHRLFLGTRIPPEMTVYDSLSGKEIQSLPGPETMDGVHYDANLKRVYMTGGRWYGTPEASPGWIYVYQQKDPDHYDVISKIKTRPGSGTSLLVPQFNRFYVASQAIGDQEAAILVFEPVQ